MKFTPQEITDIKLLLLFLVEKKDKESGGHNGFHISELNPFLEQLDKEGEIKARDTLHNTQYFLKQ